MSSLRVTDLAETLGEECFTDEQKAIIEFTQGKQVCTIKHQFLRMYKDFSPIATTKEEFFMNFAITLNEVSPILEQIKLISENQNNLSKMETYQDKIVDHEENKDREAENSSEMDKMTNKSVGISYSDDSTLSLVKNLNISKQGATEVSKLNKIEDTTTDVLLPENNNHPKRNITIEDGQIKITEIPQEERAPVTKEPSEMSYNVISYNRNEVGSGTNSTTSTTSGFENRRAEEKNIERRRSKTGTGEKDRTNKTFNESTILKDIDKVDVVTLRYKFWSSFQGLFVLLW